MSYILKPYPVYDVSSNDPGSVLKFVDPKPTGIYARFTVARYPSYSMMYATHDVISDSYAPSIMGDCILNNVLIGGYAYILQGQIETQAQKFIDYSIQMGAYMNGKWQLSLPPCADVEVEVPRRPRKFPKNYIEPIKGVKWANQIKYWLDAVESALGIKPIIYTARPQWGWLLDDKGNPPPWTKDYKFWVKWYPFSAFIDLNSRIPKSAYPAGVTEDQIVLWQYNDKGRTNGKPFNDVNSLTLAGKVAYAPTQA